MAQHLNPRIVVVGLGYVGLPLALSLARQFDVVGYDTSSQRIAELRDHKDRTGEVGETALRASSLRLTDDPSTIEETDIYVVTVPTPVDRDNEPDLSAIVTASETVGRIMRPGAVVVFESTVYPGVTEDICGVVLASASGLVCGRDFFLGYSPERINPGDKLHTVDRITKVVAGQTPEVANQLAAVYGAVTGGNVFIAKDIRTAEAAKVIENAQRDINIAFINEVSIIFSKIGVSIHDVLDAARTKWNFLDFQPGLVGGHCIGVDPYYLAHLSNKIGYHPEVILSGRRINDGMAPLLGERICDEIGQPGGRVLVLGLTFKENVSDLRNSKAAALLATVIDNGYDVVVHDPYADPLEAKSLYGVDLLVDFPSGERFDCIVGAVPHAPFRELSVKALEGILSEGGLIADIKAIWRHLEFSTSVRRWSL